MGIDADPLLVIIGAGDRRYDGWSATHKEQLDLADRASFQRFFGDRLADGLPCEHVWEHVPLDDAATAASNCLDFVRPRCDAPPRRAGPEISEKPHDSC